MHFITRNSLSKKSGRFISSLYQLNFENNIVQLRKRNLSFTSATMAEKIMNYDCLNPQVIKMEYAVRGPLVIRATQLEKELQQGITKPFTEVTKANIGDAHAMGQKPITFIRQVLSLCINPDLMNESNFPEDIKKKAKVILSGCKGGSLGSYSDSAGIEPIRKHIAEYIERRDGFPSNPDNVVLCGGASEGIRNLMKLFITRENGFVPGVLIPIPQYPLYSATIAEYGLHQVGYYLDESTNWGLDISELDRAFQESKKVCNPKILCVINPGNPTGSVLTKKNLQDVIKFAYDNKLFLLADEVYQDNVYAEGSEFHSMKKVLMEMGSPYDQMELASFMSCSKGYMGECGLRGGYSEIINIDPEVKKMYLKMISAKLCPTTVGQAVMDCVVNPPQPGEPSYDLFITEKKDVLSSLASRAKMIVETFNSMPGITCNNVQGAMYAFPQLKLPAKAIEAAKKSGQAADVFYAFDLLENTGICIVPGTGFGQRPGTFHFRTTILPQPDKLKSMLEKFRTFHVKFIEKYQ